MGTRRKAREVVLQVLYAQELTDDPIAEVVGDQLSLGDYDDELTEYVNRLAMRVLEVREELDRVIADRATNWDLARIALIDKIILRIGLCELLHFPDVPAKVCINESIEMAKKYSSADAKRFVNGILDAAYRDLVEEGA